MDATLQNLSSDWIELLLKGDKMKKIFLDAGHGAGDPGAVGNGYTEEKLTIQFVDKLEQILKKSSQVEVIKYDNSKNSYKDNAYSTLPKYDCFCEFHLNASANTGALGTEVLITSRYEADTTDKEINKALANYFPNRGIKKRDDLQNMNVCASKGYNYRLIELCFISNKNEVDHFVKYMDNIALDVANAILRSFGLVEVTQTQNNVTYYAKRIESNNKLYYNHIMKYNGTRKGIFFVDYNAEKPAKDSNNNIMYCRDYLCEYNSKTSEYVPVMYSARYVKTIVKNGETWLMHQVLIGSAKLYYCYRAEL